MPAIPVAIGGDDPVAYFDFRHAGAQQGNYNDFRVIRMRETPVVETHIVPRALAPSGFGEHSVPPVAPAVANAVFAATGRRVRKLPITPAQLAATAR